MYQAIQYLCWTGPNIKKLISIADNCKNFIRLRVHSFLLSQIQTSLKHMKYLYPGLYCMIFLTKPINYLVNEKMFKK
ncbi:hypothetical protein V1478_002052 [Vespula squamosa]|uniref:Uncharacterized protein n=1 Tax=Vespula squamosa TaxID=30214 RepID=A0ABD2BYV8_VESSQ